MLMPKAFTKEFTGLGFIESNMLISGEIIDIVMFGMPLSGFATASLDSILCILSIEENLAIYLLFFSKEIELSKAFILIFIWFGNNVSLSFLLEKTREELL
jgi:hypothetical protein